MIFKYDPREFGWSDAATEARSDSAPHQFDLR